MNTRAGERNKWATVQWDVGTQQTAHGQPIEDWQTYCERHAKVIALQGRELFTSQQRWPEVDTDVILLFDSETALITEKMRVKYSDIFQNEKLLNILAVVPDERDREICLKCKKEG